MQHFNNTIADDAQRLFNFKAGDSLSEVAEYIQPVLQIQNKINIVRGNRTTATGSLSVFTTPTDKDFYLTSLSAGMIKDVACDSATGRYDITAVIEGVSQILDAIPIIALTAQNAMISRSFHVPIKIDRGTAFAFTGTFAAGVCVRTISITGYTVETTKGV